MTLVRGSREEEFRAFAQARSGALLRTAVLLTADLAAAEDLLQVALAKAYVAWPRLRSPQRGGNPEAWVRRALATGFVDERRRRSSTEVVLGELPERPGAVDVATVVDDRDALRRALQALPPRQRAVVVLRYYDDLSVYDVADLLGIAAGTVKSQAAKGLDKLRAALLAAQEEVP